MIKQIGKIDLLILDEFLLTSVYETEVNNILEIMELRCNKNRRYSTVNEHPKDDIKSLVVVLLQVQYYIVASTVLIEYC